MGEWANTTLGEISTDISYGYTASASQEECGPKFLRITDIVPDRINWDTVPYCSIEDSKKDKYNLSFGDIVIARTGATTGYNKLITKNENAVFASYLIRYRINSEIANPYYVAYNLQSYKWDGFVEGIIGGSAQPGANAKQFASFDLLLPALKEQKAIAEVLSSLDDKIDLLHRQNKTLEALAQTLFRQWFIEEAKDEWEVGILDEVLTVKGGTTPSTKNSEFWNGDICWSTPKDLSSNSDMYLFNTARKITENGLSKIGSGLLERGTILLSSRAPVGYLAINEIPLAINQGYIAILDNKGFSKYYIFLWLKLNMEYIISNANGSTFLEISKAVFKSLKILKPPQDLRDKFDEIIIDNFEKIKENTKQIKTLKNIRDTLLPKLMSGEVRIKI